MAVDDKVQVPQETAEVVLGDAMHHEGTTCPVCGATAVCGHPVKYPAVCAAAPWVPNVWVKGP